MAVVMDQHRPEPVDPQVGVRQAKFRQGGIFALAEELNSTPEDAIDVAIREGMLPRRWKSSRGKLCELLALDGLKHVDAATKLGVSRWTVATWRDQLGIQAKRKRRPNRVDIDLTEEEIRESA